MRNLRVAGGCILLVAGIGGLVTMGYAKLQGFAAGGAAASGMILVVAGILAILSGLSKDSIENFDPQETLNVYPWANDEQPWSVGEALGMAVWTCRKVGGKLALVALSIPVVALIAGGTSVGAVLRTRFESTPTARALSIGTDMPMWLRIGAPALPTLLVLLVMPLATPAIVKLTLAAMRKERVTFGDAKGALHFFPRLVCLTLGQTVLAALLGAPVRYLAVSGMNGFTGVMMVVATFIYFAGLVVLVTLLLFAPFFVVDQDLALVPAIKKSWRLGSHHFGKLWLLAFAFLPLRLIGNISVIGELIAMPMWFAALAYGYLRATGRSGMPYFPTDASSGYTRSFLRFTLIVVSALFAGLIFWVEHLPKRRGMAFDLIGAALRASTIVTQIVVVVVMLALILPYVLDQLEGRRFTTFVAARHVRSQKSGFLTIISVLSICGVAISSCALSSVVSVMGGFSQDLRNKILGSGAHIVVDTTGGTAFADYAGTLDHIRKSPGVIGATPVVHGEVMAASASNLAGVVVTGIEPSSSYTVIDLVKNIEVGRIDYLEHPELLSHLPANEIIGMGPGGEPFTKGIEMTGGIVDDIDPAVRAVLMPNKPDRPGIVLGRELAKTLHVYVGDEITLVSPLGDLGPMGVMPRTKKFRVAAIFYSGMYEYDATFVYTMMDVAQDYFQTQDKISALEIKVDDAENVDPITSEVVSDLTRDKREDLRVRDWREINKNLFSALKLERFATFIILSLAILVASFCIICTLLLMVTEKGKEIAILKAIGATDSSILTTFIIEGMIIGGIGMIFGVVTSVAFGTGVQWYGLLLDPDVYYIDKLPIRVDTFDYLKVAAAALGICALATLYPAYAASKLRPVDGLRGA